jgi:Spy/CpxP family protein refolding chaperone
MKHTVRIITFVLAAGCSLGAAAFEDDGPQPHGSRMGMLERHGPGGHGPMPAPAAALTEAQEDKLFSIMHAQEPQRRELDRAAHKARTGLRELARSGQFDESKAAALAQAEGKAVAALSLLRARTDAQVAALLSPEQREQFGEGGPGPGRPGRPGRPQQ